MFVNLTRISVAAAAVLLAVAVLSTVVSLGASRTSQAASPPTLQFACDYLKRASIDPIMDPAVPHVHEFYGNRSVNANSTHNSLRANPATTCRIKEAASSYWHPAFREGGKVRRPLMVRNYYRDINGINRNMRPIPDGLRNIATEANGNVRYKCGWRGSPRTKPPVSARFAGPFASSFVPLGLHVPRRPRFLDLLGRQRLPSLDHTQHHPPEGEEVRQHRAG